MVKNCIPVGFPITSDALIFFKHRAKHLLRTVAVPVSQKGGDTLKFLLIQHRISALHRQHHNIFMDVVPMIEIPSQERASWL
jgi:hypothetical protein